MAGVLVARLLALFFVSCVTGLRSARLSPHSHLQSAARDTVLEDDDAPPADGCQGNYWDKFCCCFIESGILQQNQCSCSSSSGSCEKKLRLSYSPKPARSIPDDGPIMWLNLEKGGYISGFQTVGQRYCMATPASGPQVNPHERSYDCTCSTAMGNNVEMQCGSSCLSNDCQRTNPRVTNLTDFWSPFTESRGTCCRSSYKSQTEGCPQELAPITEARAKTIVSDALVHVANHDEKAFLIRSSEYLVEGMTKSFASAKEKKMSTSRSGAQFFFSGDYAYILKSINPSEYDVLAKIAQNPLISHIQRFSNLDIALQQGGHCTEMWIQHYDPLIWKPFKDTSEWQLARAALTTGGENGAFFGYWNVDEKKSLVLQSTIYVHATERHLAYWCPMASAWRIQRNTLDSIDYSECEDRSKDPLFRFLRSRKEIYHMEFYTDEDVDSVYNHFTESFRSKADASGFTTNVVRSRCTRYWRPASLINEFLLGFKYMASPWMVIRNSVTAVKQELDRHGFEEYQSNDLFDVKPFPIHSDERPALFRMQFVKDAMVTWRNWDGVRTNLQRDLSFMDSALSNEMVDYSMLISAFYINDERLVLDTITLPNCIEQPLRDVRVVSSSSRNTGIGDYGDVHGSILVCFSIIDMLMEFTIKKVPENLVLFNKWSDWSEKIMLLFDCLGHPKPAPQYKCAPYIALQDMYKGVDIPSIRSAVVKDVSQVFNADNEVIIKDPASWIVSTWKCCCNAFKCILADTNQQSKWYPGKKLVDLAKGIALNSKGCGSLVGKDWHSYWRGPKKCVLPTDAAEKVFANVVLDSEDGWV